MDRRLVMSVCAGVAALGAGVVAEASHTPFVALLAGAAGLAGAVGAASIAATARATEQHLAEVDEDRARLRRELEALAAIFAEETTRRSTFGEPAPTVRLPGDNLVDEVTGLLHEQTFPMTVHHRVAAARRQLQPVSVVLFELDGLDTADTHVREQALTVLGDIVRRTLRECDTACRIGDTRAAAVLEDTAESGAVWAAERVRGTLHGSPVGDALTISAGIACYPSHALHARELIELASRALASAQSHGRDHVEVAHAD